MMIGLLFIHQATVETYLGAGSRGATYATPRTFPGFLDDGLMVTPEAGGQQVVNKTTFYTSVDNVAAFPPGSRLTCNGRSMTVTAIRRRDGGSLLSAASHLEVDVA